MSTLTGGVGSTLTGEIGSTLTGGIRSTLRGYLNCTYCVTANSVINYQDDDGKMKSISSEDFVEPFLKGLEKILF